MQHPSENPYRPYTQDHENWSANLEREQRRAREEQDANDRALAEMHEQQQAEQRQLDAERQQAARSRNKSARSDSHKRAPTNRISPGNKTEKPTTEKLSGFAKLVGVVGAIGGGAWTYQQHGAYEEVNWWMVIGAGVITGTVASKLYKVILLGIIVFGAFHLYAWYLDSQSV